MFKKIAVHFLKCYLFQPFHSVNRHQIPFFQSGLGIRNSKVKYRGKSWKLGHWSWSVKVRGSSKIVFDKLQPVDKAKVYHMGSIHHAYDIYLGGMGHLHIVTSFILKKKFQ